MKEQFRNIRKAILDSIQVEGEPTLAIIHVANKDDAASKVYIKNKVKTCESVRIKTEIINIEEYQTFDNIKTTIRLLGLREDVNGIILQLPLPEHLKAVQQELLDAIPFEKDVDGLSSASVARLWTDSNFYLAPATASAVCKFLESSVILEGKKIAIINRSALIGKPLLKMLMDRNCTVTLMHSKTKEYDKETVFYDYDVVITGIGNTSLANYWSDKFDSIWVDCGIIRGENGIHGDAGDLISDKITPVPGGIGTLTTACIAYNTYKAWKYQKEVKR